MVSMRSNWLVLVTIKDHWFKSEQASLLGAGLATLATIAVGQSLYAWMPTTTLLLFHSRRLQQTQTHAITQLHQDVSTKLNTFTQKVEQLHKATNKLEQQQVTVQTILPRQNAIANLQQQFTEFQQQLADLDASAEDLHDHTRDLGQIRHQVATLKQLIEAQSQFRQTSNPTCSQKPKPVLAVTQSSDRGRVAVFIDSANLENAARERSIKIDYEKLLSVLAAESSLVGARFYIGIDPTNAKQSSFLSRLREMGYRVVSKPIVHHGDSIKANVDMELGLDMVNFANCYDTAILVSGDGDFTCVVDHVKDKGIKVEVVSWRGNTSNRLISAADSYIDLETIKDQISWESRN